MRSFLREHWPWIVGPIVLLALLAALLLWLRGDGMLDQGVYTL